MLYTLGILLPDGILVEVSEMKSLRLRIARTASHFHMSTIHLLIDRRCGPAGRQAVFSPFVGMLVILR